MGKSDIKKNQINRYEKNMKNIYTNNNIFVLFIFFFRFPVFVLI